jgi:hypothetical protein
MSTPGENHGSGDDGRMKDAQPAEFLFSDLPPAIRETGMALRALIFRTVPDAVETVRPGWRWIAYSLPEKGKVRNFAWIGPERKHIHLGFEHGTLLADPDRILHGAEERLKKFRYFTFEPAIDVDEAVLADFIDRAAALAVMPAAARRALTELGAESVEVGPDEVPPDWELVSESANRPN